MVEKRNNHRESQENGPSCSGLSQINCHQNKFVGKGRGVVEEAATHHSNEIVISKLLPRFSDEPQIRCVDTQGRCKS